MGAEEQKCWGQPFPKPGSAGLCHSTLATSNSKGKGILNGTAIASRIKPSTIKQIWLSSSKLSYQKERPHGSSAKLKAPRVADTGIIMAERMLCTTAVMAKLTLSSVVAKPTLSSVVGHLRHRERCLQPHLFLPGRWHPKAPPGAVDRRKLSSLSIKNAISSLL